MNTEAKNPRRRAPEFSTGLQAEKTWVRVIGTPGKQEPLGYLPWEQRHTEVDRALI